MNQSSTYQQVTGQVVELVHRHSLSEVSAVGLSGSYTDGHTDQFSDIDICVYVDGTMPAFEARQEAYSRMGFTDFIYQDVDFEYSRGDGLSIQGVRCDFNWMDRAVIAAFLNRLSTDFDCAEWIPGGTLRVQALCDPQGIISSLQHAVPAYSDDRAKYRIRKALTAAHRTFCDLKWLQKAAFRNDIFSFLKYEYELFDRLFYSLFALNHVWLSDEKRLVQRIANFPYVPENIEPRIQSIIMKQDDYHDLTVCMSGMQQVFTDTVACVHRRYPDLALPEKWC